jgi:hypothetical protein
MREANKKRTICEVLREINDKRIEKEYDALLPLINEASRMASRMARKLYEYNKEFDLEWWEDNPDYEQDLLKRMDR